VICASPWPFYERLGFATRKYDDRYGYASRDQVELHLGVPGRQAQTAPHTGYL
jgi:hypothetical protein